MSDLFNRLSLRDKVGVALAVPMLVLAFLTLDSAQEQFARRDDANRGTAVAQITQSVGAMVGNLQRERGTSAGFVGSKGKKNGAKLNKLRGVTDASIIELKTLLSEQQLSGSECASKVLKDLDDVGAIRKEVDALKGDVFFGYYSARNRSALLCAQQLGASVGSPEIARQLRAIAELSWTMEYSGIERGRFNKQFSSGKLDSAAFLKTLGFVDLQEEHLATFLLSASAASAQALDQIRADAKEVVEIRSKASAAAVRSNLLATVGHIAGYGGIIHDFKNFVLRGEAKDREAFLSGYDRLSKALNRAANQPGNSDATGAALATITSTFEAYRAALDTVAAGWAAGKPVRALDRAVVIDDAPAVQAMASLGQSFTEVTAADWWKASSARIGAIAKLSGELTGKAIDEANHEAAEANTTLTTSLIIALVVIALIAITLRSVVHRVNALNAVTVAMGELASGDLSADEREVHGTDEVAKLENGYNLLLTNLRGLVGAMQNNARQLATTSAELLATSQEQQTGTAEQAASVEETKVTLETLVTSAHSVAQLAQGVFDNAEVTQKNAAVIAGRIGDLASHTQRIGEILTLIKDIANKSDLLALNAALEGTKAGEAGRGFSLVANQMQRLTEQVMGSVKNIEMLTRDITKATGASVLATEEATKLAAETTASARQITSSVQQQQAGTQQATVAMNQITKVSQDAAAAAAQIVEAAGQLSRLAADLDGDVSRYNI